MPKEGNKEKGVALKYLYFKLMLIKVRLSDLHILKMLCNVVHLLQVPHSTAFSRKYGHLLL